MIIYIDQDFKCYTTDAPSRTQVECEFFDGKAPKVIESYRFVPEGQTWHRSDGVDFDGEMISAFVSRQLLEAYQQAYDEQLDMRMALEELGVTE